MDACYLGDILAVQVIHQGLILKITTICQQLLHSLVKSLQIEKTWYTLKFIYQNNVVMYERKTLKYNVQSLYQVRMHA